MDIKGLQDLQKACSILGLDYRDFLSNEEIEKSVENTNYKILYEQQKNLNEKILGNIGEISKFFDTQLDKFKTDVSNDMESQIKELEKSFGTLKEEVDGMKKSPMRNAKSAKSVTVIEKAVNGNNNGMVVNCFHFLCIFAI